MLNWCRAAGFVAIIAVLASMGIFAPARDAHAIGLVSQSGPRLYTSSSSSSSGGGKVDGNTATVLITGAGSNTTPFEFWGGKTGNLDAGTQNTAVSKSGWTTSVVMPRYDNAVTYSRSKSMSFDSRYTKAVNPGNSGAFALGFDMGAAIVEYSFEGNVYIGSNTSPNLTDLQLKIHRLTFIDDIQDTNTAYYTAKRGVVGSASDFLAYPVGGLIESSTGTHTNGTNYFSQSGSYQHAERIPDLYPAWNTGRWYRYKFWGKPGTGTNTDDGQWTLDLWRLDTGAKVVTNYDINARTYVDARRGRWFELQNYHGNAAPQPGVAGTADNTTNFEEAGDGYAYWDDVWLSYGTGSRKRLVCTNASTWAASTKWWNQPYSTWTSDSIAFTFNDPLGQCTYFYAIDSTDTVINSSGVAKAALTAITPVNDDIFEHFAMARAA